MEETTYYDLEVGNLEEEVLTDEVVSDLDKKLKKFMKKVPESEEATIDSFEEFSIGRGDDYPDPPPITRGANVTNTSNSPLVVYKRLSPNYSSRNGAKIDRIAIHHMAGNMSIETCGNLFASGSREASATYGIGSDGRVGQYVDESYAPWTTSSYSQCDRYAVTIEVANDVIGGNWHVSSKALQTLLDLLVDICKRNGIKKLNYTGDKSGNLLMHCWFTATACPGPYLKESFPVIAAAVNKRLSGDPEPTPTPEPSKKLDEDGIFGPASVSAGQKWLGTPVDGIISDQVKSMRKYYPGITAVEFGSGGSVWVRKLQAKVGASQDGYLGPETVKAVQRFLNKNGANIEVDGIWGALTSKAFQKYLNKVL